MADTLTSKGFTLLDPTLAYDVNKFNANTQKTNDLMGTILCTSGTRPSTGLYDGMTIYETDTKLTYYRSGGAWVGNAIPPMQTAANQAARDALTGLWPGRQVWRTDTSWIETYDGTAWRVPNATRTTSLALITHPLAQQTANLTSDSTEYRWDGVSTWNSVRYLGPPPRVRRRHNAASQATGAGAAYKVQFDTQIESPIDVTYASGNFTFSRSGRYLFTASLRLSAVSELYIWFSRSGTNNDNIAKDSKPAGTGLNKGTSGEVMVTAADDWSVWVWSSVSVNILKESANANDLPPYFTATYLGPR